jgi:hypothetical protein
MIKPISIPCHDLNAKTLMQLAIGFPTPKKVEETLASYNETGHYLLGLYREGKLMGLIGLHVCENKGMIKHIAVLESYQRKGIGKTLITEVIRRFQLKAWEAETDEEARDFYEKCGFQCTPFEGKHTTRYQCEWFG